VSWLRVSGTLPSGRHSTSRSRTQLTIQNVTTSDAGVYECRGRNSHSTANHSVRLTVVGLYNCIAFQSQYHFVSGTYFVVLNQLLSCITSNCVRLKIQYRIQLASWRRSTVVERWSLTGKLSLFCARLLAGRMITLWVRRPLSVSQHGQISHPSLRGR